MFQVHVGCTRTGGSGISNNNGNKRRQEAHASSATAAKESSKETCSRGRRPWRKTEPPRGDYDPRPGRWLGAPFRGPQELDRRRGATGRWRWDPCGCGGRKQIECASTRVGVAPNQSIIINNLFSTQSMRLPQGGPGHRQWKSEGNQDARDPFSSVLGSVPWSPI